MVNVISKRIYTNLPSSAHPGKAPSPPTSHSFYIYIYSTSWVQQLLRCSGKISSVWWIFYKTCGESEGKFCCHLKYNQCGNTFQTELLPHCNVNFAESESISGISNHEKILTFFACLSIMTMSGFSVVTATLGGRVPPAGVWNSGMLNYVQSTYKTTN